MIDSDRGKTRTRIYQTYRKTTSENPFKGKEISLGRQIRQYSQRWSRFLPADHQSPILDVGCGGGEFLLFLKSLGYLNCSGIDISPEQIKLAKERGIENVYEANACEFLKNKEEQYAVINLQNVLEHFTRSELLILLDAVVSSLKPGGRVMVVVPNSKSIFSSYIRYADLTHELSFTPESLRQICAVVGLRPLIIGELGPLIHSPFSAIRWIMWQFIRFGIWLIMVAENANYGDRIYTHDMFLIAEKV